MSIEAIKLVTQGIQALIETKLAVENLPTQVFLGSPAQRNDVNTHLVSVFMFHLAPNGEMRNAPRTINGAPDPVLQDALPFDLYYLISFFRSGNGSETVDLHRMGATIAALHETTTVAEAIIPDQSVRLTPVPYPMEEISRVWGLMNDKPYVSSFVCLASPVFIDARAAVRGAPVRSRRLDPGHSAETPDVFGRKEGGS